MSTQAMGASLLTSLALVGLLGFRHGFDADHIAAVDGMTRARQLEHSYWSARWVGLHFALGHSAAILIASLLLYGQSAALPAWLDGLGMVISTCFLLAIAASNLNHAWRGADAAPAAAGALTVLLLRMTGRHLHPAWVGMAFAMSFDSLAQAAFFASKGSALNGVAAVIAMALAFGAGMVVADAGNGALVAWCMRRSDALARQAARCSSALIAALALLTACSGVLREFHAGFAQTWDDQGAWVGAGVVALTTLGLVSIWSWQRLVRQRGGAVRPQSARSP
ncbi:MAG: hypothetical protein WA210_01395 [Burkholderiaceae bacterium]